MTHIIHDEKVYFMRIFIYLLILTHSLQYFAKADEISDFKIEGIGLGDSLLNFFDEKKIITSKRDFYKDDEFLISLLPTLEDDTMYGYIQVHYKKNDKGYIVHGIDGLIDVDIQECLKMQMGVVNEISSMFSNLKLEGPFKFEHSADVTGRSTTKHYEWRFKNAKIEVVCYDFVKPMKYPDGLNVAIQSNELQKWLNTKAYK